jgi:hypothetical protein
MDTLALKINELVAEVQAAEPPTDSKTAGRARHVPDQVVGHGRSQSLVDRPAGLQTWVAARDADR